MVGLMCFNEFICLYISLRDFLHARISEDYGHIDMARQQNTMEIMQSYPIFTQLEAEEEALEARRWAFFRDVD